MIRVTITSRATGDIYGLLVKKEVELRKKNSGTLHRKGAKKRGEAKWTHSTYPGWVRFRKGLGGVAMAIVHSKTADAEWQLLSSLIGFLDRHFRAQIANIIISYTDRD